MATLGARFVDLIDVYKRTDRADIATIIELLSETNPILDDAVAMECNNGTKHRTTIRTGLPAVTWGKLYQGVPQAKSTTAQVDDATGFVESLSTIDTRLLELSPNEGALRLTEAQAFIESMSQEVASRMIYGDQASDPEQFTGLAPRFSSLSAPNASQIVDGGGTGSDNTSVWFVTWGDRFCHTLYPKGTNAGLTRDDKGEQRVLDENNNAYYVKEEMFRWNIGLTVRDWRQVVRVANIDVSELAAGNVDIYALMRSGFWAMNQHRVSGGNIVIYANSNVLEALDAASTPTASTTTSYVRLGMSEQDGKEIMTYRNMPVRQLDAILNTEDQVT